MAVEELVAAALTSAERHVARQLTQGLSPAQAEALDALLVAPAGASMSVLAWARQPPGVAWAIALSPAWSRRSDNSGRSASSPARAEGVHQGRACGGSRARAGASRRSTYAPCRRSGVAPRSSPRCSTPSRALTDDGVGVFDRAVGRMFRRAEIGEQDALLRDARAAGDKVRLLAKLGAALIEARDAGADLEVAVADAVGWDRLARGVAEAERLARPDKTDLPALAARAWPVLHRLGPLFLGAFRLRAVPAAAGTLRAVDALREVYASGGRRWPRSPPTSFLRPAWRDAVQEAEGTAKRRVWEAATLLALRDRLRAGDVWVEGSRQWRAVEDQLIPLALFAAMRDAGPLPVAVPATAEEYLAERRALLDRRLTEVAAKAEADRLEDVRIGRGELKVSPLKAATPEEAETLVRRLYGMVPAVRVTDLLVEVDRWTGFSAAFDHLHTGLPADDPRVVLTAVLADATNLGLTRMADACSVATYRQLAWTAEWHLREETYRRALAILVGASQAQPLAARFGAADVSSSDGQHFPTGGPGEAGGRRGQRPVRARRDDAALHARLGAPRAVPHGGHPAVR